MHVYIAEAVRIMMLYGRGQSSFIPLLWTGLRDWETSSAWTRGKVRVSFSFALEKPAEPILSYRSSSSPSSTAK